MNGKIILYFFLCDVYILWRQTREWMHVVFKFDICFLFFFVQYLIVLRLWHPDDWCTQIFTIWSVFIDIHLTWLCTFASRHYVFVESNIFALSMWLFVFLWYIWCCSVLKHAASVLLFHYNFCILVFHIC